ncbi:MAG: hypothetical protein J1E31_00795 [Helicobacter sp.]|nr:hypothetical protein [Helicobacter sp.]
MSLAKTIRPFFATVIAGVEIDNKLCAVTLKYYKRGKVFKTQTKEFKTILGELPAQATRFLKATRNRHPFTYITTLSNTMIQGAINTDRDSEFEKYGIKKDDIVRIGFDNQWSAYVSRVGIAETREKMLRVGVDFIISPFVILYHLAKATFQDSCKLYVLFQRSNITMIVTKLNEGVLFGSYYVLESEIDSKLKLAENSLSEDIDDIDELGVTDDIQKELSDIEKVDLDNQEDDDKLIEALKEDSTEESQENMQEKKDNLDDFSRVNMATKYIQSALNEFYSNAIYKSEFINEIVLFNPHDIPEETLQYIQETTLLEVKVMPCSVTEELAILGFESYKFFESKGKV